MFSFPQFVSAPLNLMPTVEHWLLLGVTVHKFMLISICQCLCHNDSIMESWFHRSRGVSGFIVSCVSWFHRFSGVNSFMVS